MVISFSILRQRALMERLVRPRRRRIAVEWYGETHATLSEYIQRSIREGNHCTADDPREMADHYRAYPSYSEMPGFGVCGFAVEKPPVSQQVTKS
jgi:hypothetical protein